MSRPLAPAVLALAAVLAMACARAPRSGPPSATITRWQDLIVDPREHTAVFDTTTLPHVCADETAFGIELRGGEHRRYRFRLAEPSSLYVAACLDPGGGTAQGAGKLELRVQRAAGGGERLALPLAGGWQEARLDLAPEPAGEVVMRLDAEAGAGARIVVRDLAVRTDEPADAPAPARRVILISLDAFREDAIGAIGHRTATPVLDRLVSESERFTPSWSAEISTKPSHASMLTGIPAAVHGCDRGEVPLAPDFSTLAERLSAAGAATAGFAGTAPYFGQEYGLNQGFGTWRVEAWTTAQELRQAAEWIARHRQDDSFLFVHLYAAHADMEGLPYESPGTTRRSVAERFGLAGYGCRADRCGAGLLLALNLDRGLRLPRESEVLRFLYERGAEALDHDLGELVADLEAGGLWQDSLVVLTADHGEQFDEHGYFLHTTPHEETLRVPLLVRWPGGRAAGTTSGRPTTSLDIAPTVLAYFGLPATDLVGRNLAEPAREEAPVMVSKDAVRVGDLKLLLPTAEFPEALYDLARDPGERTNLLPDRRADADRLSGVWLRATERARQLAGVAPATRKVPFDAAALERLRSLGYLR